MKEGMKMNFPRDWMLFKNELIECSRNFTKMNFTNIKKNHEDSTMIDILRATSHHVEVLEIENIFFLDQQFFGCFPKIQKLSISCVNKWFVVKKDDKIDEPPILKLKTLILRRACIESLTEINLQSEKIIINVEWQGIEEIGDFLKIQENLTCLGMKCYADGEYVEELFEIVSSNMKQNTTLRELFVIFDGGDDSSDDEYDYYIRAWKRGWERFVEFMDIMKGSLRSLEIKVRKIPVSVFTKVINDMQLTRLYIDCYPDFPSKFKFERTNNHLKTLVIKDSSSLSVKLLLSAFPQIQYLSLKNVFRTDITIETIANNLKSLKYLHISISSVVLDGNLEISIPSFSAFSFEMYSTVILERICLFLNVNPSIETLEIESSIINHQTLHQITQIARNLKNLTIRQKEFDINMEMLQMISANCPSLESFQVQTDSAQCNVKRYGKIHLKYDVVDGVFDQENPIWRNDKDFPAICNLDITSVHSYNSDYDSYSD